MKLEKVLGGFLVALKLLAQLLKWGVIKIDWDLPGKPLLYAKLSKIFEDQKVTGSEIVTLLEAVKEETPNWVNQGIDILIWAITFVKPIVWNVADYAKFWEPIIVRIKDGKLTNKEIGDILETVLNW